MSNTGETVTLVDRYQRGELEFQKGVDIDTRIAQVRSRLDKLFADNDRFEFVEVRPSRFDGFADGSGRPQVAVVKRDGYFHMEEDVYSELFDKPDEEIRRVFAEWEDA